MKAISANDFLDELRYDIKENDRIKAKLVLSKIGLVDDQTKKVALFEVNRADDEFAIPLIVDLIAEHPEFYNRYPQFKEILCAKALYHPELLLSMVAKNGAGKRRRVLVEALGELRLDEATPKLVEILNQDEDEETIKTVITALGMIGEGAAVTPVSEYLYSGNLVLTIAAIHSLGQMASPEAFQYLAEKLGDDPDLDIMIFDVFRTDQSPEAIAWLNISLASHHAHQRNAAKQRLLDMGAKAVPVLIQNLHQEDPDLLVHTLNVLGEIGDESAIAPIRNLLHNDPKNANVRFAAYEALGLLPVAKRAFALAQGLSDPVLTVRAAAASAIDHNFNSMLAAGLTNLLQSGKEEAASITETVLNAECGQIFLGLINGEIFRQYAIDFLVTHAHPDTRNYFVDLMKQNGYDDLAEVVTIQAKRDAASSLTVFAVDDSKMILNLYRGMLYDLGCEPVLFEFPAKALQAVKDHPPDFIFTDLNMPHINGIELIRQVREHHDQDSLPIVMVTTQNETHDNQAALDAGVNAILRKPFTQERLEDVLFGMTNTPIRPVAPVIPVSASSGCLP
jgi:CheY-like chemotaxis protein/HEAT repeat protein